MRAERQDGCHIDGPPRVSHDQTTTVAFPTLLFRVADAILSRSALGAATRRFAASFRVQSRSSSVPVVAWGQLCTEPYRRARKARAKTTDQLIGRPTKWSDQSSSTSPTRFGLQTLRLRSPRFVAAVFAPRNAISGANENGPVMRSRSSSPKSCVVIPCATSRSFPNGHRRPF